MNHPYKMLIDGEWVSGRETFEVINPFNGEVLGVVPKAGKEDVDRAVRSAKDAFETQSEMPAHRRAEILETMSGLILEHREEFAELIAKEAGKAWKYALGEADRAAETFKFAAEEARQLHGETVPMDASAGGEGRLGFFLRFPIGVIAAIPPFNFPLNLAAHKVAPAIAAGNTVVLKPSSYTPLTAAKMGELLMEAGLPKGVLNIIYGPGATAGSWLVTHPDLAMITFTGSPPVGKWIKNHSDFKKVTLELGSNSASIVDEDADLAWAVLRNVIGAFANSGQICISVQRIYVHQAVCDSFVEKFVEASKKQIVGDPLDKSCDVGPMISESEAERAESWVKEAVQQGAKILTGGTREKQMFRPTVLTDVKPAMKVMQDEVFAPVVSIVPFTEFKDAVDWVNASRYGLQAGVFTKNLAHATYAIRKINVGGVIINDYPTFRVDQMPYGGNKESGLGREGLKYAIEEMTNPRMVVIRD
ncbi:succinate-semialdehyde dehydrogenase [NADP(+)] [bacterium BMS3Abin05]|nr:succinate-semialdehyde dehydrogenase [NADP(+)] [bacterium BMS3Abin05]